MNNFHNFDLDDDKDNNNNDDDNNYDDNDDNEYEYEYEDEMEQNDLNEKSGNIYTGLNINNDLNIILSDLSRYALYPVYKQLSEFCLVDVDPNNFYAATLTIMDQKQQILILQLCFPIEEPYFPNSPPSLTLQSKFLSPNHKYNILFNCHPQLLSYNWNICTDIVKIIKDLQSLSSISRVETNDDDYLINESLVRKIINIINTNRIDITHLFPNEDFHQLHSFGIIYNKQLDDVVGNKTKTTGTGYSSSRTIEAHNSIWDKANNRNLHNIQSLRDLVYMIHPQKEALSQQKVSNTSNNICKEDVTVDNSDMVLLDSIYFLIHHFISVTITLDELFSNMQFYEIVLEYLLYLPKPSPHIEAIPPGISALLVTINRQNMKQYMNVNELELIAKVELLYQQQTYEDIDASPLKKRIAENEISVCEKDNNNNCSNSSTDHLNSTQISIDTNTCNKSSRTRTSTTTTTVAIMNHHKNTSDTINSNSSSSSSNLNINHKETGCIISNNKVVDNVVMIEEPFKSHLFLNQMPEVTHLPSTWFRKLRFELSSMTESVPSNVLVFSGIQCSQPNLMKVLMFPESIDTPYYGGCFEFDVFIPSDYPNIPPKVLLVTTGYGTVRFNPNLYNCGKVCLSLLGTWAGEPWIPGVSNLTQVINSILFLIFVEEPYYNEPGYTKSESADIKSLKYNEDIQINTLKYAYLDFFQKKNQFSDWILPILCKNWNNKGHEVAITWLQNRSNLKSIIQTINNEVVNYELSITSNK